MRSDRTRIAEKRRNSVNCIQAGSRLKLSPALDLADGSLRRRQVKSRLTGNAATDRRQVPKLFPYGRRYGRDLR